MWDPHVIVPPSFPPRPPPWNEGEHSPGIAPQQLFDEPGKPSFSQPTGTPTPTPLKGTALKPPLTTPTFADPADETFDHQDFADEPPSQKQGEIGHSSQKQGEPVQTT
ncbi:hypothetical protein ACA910_011641 [Epithemia clementina (nom. ined.)]